MEDEVEDEEEEEEEEEEVINLYFSLLLTFISSLNS